MTSKAALALSSSYLTDILFTLETVTSAERLIMAKITCSREVGGKFRPVSRDEEIPMFVANVPRYRR